MGSALAGIADAPEKFIHATGCGCSSCGGKPIAQRELSSTHGAANRGVIFMGPDHVEVKGIPFPELALDSTSSPVVSERQTRKCNHGAILKVRPRAASVRAGPSRSPGPRPCALRARRGRRGERRGRRATG
jgi:hypothetical protein